MSDLIVGGMEKSGAGASARAAQASLEAATLEPGRYTASAIVRVGERVVGKVSRDIAIDP